jgi:hypothetical protein
MPQKIMNVIHSSSANGLYNGGADAVTAAAD